MNEKEKRRRNDYPILNSVFIIGVIILSGLHAQCEELNQSQCISYNNCNWVNETELHICNDDWDNYECENQTGCNSGCTGWLWVYGIYVYCMDGVWTCTGTYQTEISYCSDAGNIPGDINEDNIVNILDVILSVTWILDGEYNVILDMNNDNSLDILDIIEIVNIILGTNGIYAESASIKITENSLILKADGIIRGVQLTLKHKNNFNIQLTDKAMFSDYRINKNLTTVVIIEPESEILFTYSGDFEIVDYFITNSENEIQVKTIIDKFKISAFPNPFNPNTVINFEIPIDGLTQIMIYDISGRLVKELLNTNLIKGQHQIEWNAENYPSGVYFLNISSLGNNINIKLILLK